MLINIYTDGACSGNPGPGGAAAIITIEAPDENKKIGIVNYEAETTNQRMELKGFEIALKQLAYDIPLPPIDEVLVYTDSAYLYNAFTQGWIENWEKNGWKNAKKESVKNQDLWKSILYFINLLYCTQGLELKFNKVKGHSGVEENELADELAVLARKNNTAFPFYYKNLEVVYSD